MFAFCRISLFVLCLIVIGCTPKHSNITGDVSLPITPIMVPTTFSFSSFNTRMLHAESYTTVGSKTVAYMITDLSVKVNKIGEEYMWEMQTNELKTKQQNIKSDIPIFDIRTLTDAFGNIKKMEISSPALTRKGVPFYPGSPRYEASKKGAENNMTVLRDQAIKSGDILFYINPASLGNLRFEKSDLKIGPKLLGYSYLNGQKVVVAQISESGVPAYNVKNRTKLVLDFKGSYIFDAGTMLQIGGENVVDVRSYSTGEHARILNTISQ